MFALRVLAWNWRNEYSHLLLVVHIISEKQYDYELNMLIIYLNKQNSMLNMKNV